MLVDEAYFHFYGETVIDLVGTVPNVLWRGRFRRLMVWRITAWHAGGIVESMRWIRRVLSPYSVNSVALACFPAALEDTTYLDWYVGEVIAARGDRGCAGRGRSRRWPSQANFVLVEIGAKHAEFVRRMRAGGVLVRDRSNDPGCDGFVRITLGRGSR